MDTSKILPLLLICMLSISSISPILARGTCRPCKGRRRFRPPFIGPPVLPPPSVVPPTPPSVVPPPAVVPPVTPPPGIVPPITLPPINIPPVLPIGGPPLGPLPLIPPMFGPPSVPSPTPGCPPPAGCQPPSGCAPPPAPLTCPVDQLKLGYCVDLLGGLVKINAGDPAANQCCPLIGGLLEVEAAICLCTTLKIKLLNSDLYIPIFFQLLVVCGKTPPPGFTCKT